VTTGRARRRGDVVSELEWWTLRRHQLWGRASALHVRRQALAPSVRGAGLSPAILFCDYGML
jgi:hypothetical protein